MVTDNKTEAEVIKYKSNRIMKGIQIWASFYRANPHRFAKDYLGLKLDLFQQILLYGMFLFSNFIYLASRGGGKSFLIAVYCVIKCILFPGSRICIASKTRKQAQEIIDKIKEILMPNSPNLQREVKEIIANQVDSHVEFFNTSKIVVVTASESARHNRATDLVVDEFRMVDKAVIDSVLRKFLTASRHPSFLDRPEYKDYPREKTKELYASSCWYESHWSYELVRSYVSNMIYGRSYFCAAMPYQIAIKEGRLDREKIEDEMSESTFSPTSFLIEMECLFFGQSDGSLYNFDDIDRDRKIKLPYIPQSRVSKLIDKNFLIPPKQQGEIRILSADIALMSSSKNNNDATSIFINQMLPTQSGRYVSNIVYTENNEGLRTDAQALSIRKLFAEFGCDYLVIDGRGLGLGILDLLMSDLYDQTTGEMYGALSCCNNEEIAGRCSVKNAPKVIWIILGSQELNSKCALGLRDAFKQGQVRLLISEYEAEDELLRCKGYASLSSSEALDYKLPYIHTSLLVNELINLEYESKNGIVKVKEKTGARKDRYSSLSYNIYVAKQLERDLIQKNKSKTFNPVAFSFKTPKTKK